MGNPPTMDTTARWMRYRVAAKSRHFFARSTYEHTKHTHLPIRRCACMHHLVARMYEHGVHAVAVHACGNNLNKTNIRARTTNISTTAAAMALTRLVTTTIQPVKE